MRKYIIIITLATTFIVGCGKNNTTPPDPEVTTLTFPAQNSACTTGAIISSTQSSIVFTWNSAGNTDSYEIDIKNLLTGTVATQIVTANQYTVTLLRDTPYSWYVVSMSRSSATTAKSDVWKFYNAGVGTVSHPPFPADNLSPAYGQNVTPTTGAINLGWTAIDPDNDIAGYDIYVGTTTTPALFKSNITDKFVNGVTVTSGTTYYWKVITKDVAGNTSDSGVFQFKVN
ncbi:MAG: hypothetical protein ABIN91_02880 [Mucilaginibacter sp.]|uniref:hypothetical protein n=1 Tax=Mucilaginibacter sp. TaxID=1882438 RepID=UPI003267DDB2